MVVPSARNDVGLGEGYLGTCPAPECMARDANWLGLAIDRILIRGYRWDRPWTSVGIHQLVTPEIWIGTEGWSRRPTGGAAVRHGADITLCAGVPARFLTPFEKAFVPFRSAIATALAEVFGETVVPGGAGAQRPQGDCFAVAQGPDLVDEQLRKRVGLALRRTRTVVLMQASVPDHGAVTDNDAAQFTEAFAVALRVTLEGADRGP